MSLEPTTLTKSFYNRNKSFCDYVIRADLGRALKAHYDRQLEEQPPGKRLADLLNKIDELEDTERAPRNERT